MNRQLGGGGTDAEGERQGTSSGGQDQVQTETITIRPSRKRTAVTKMGAVMIDTIQKADKSGAK